MVFPLQTPNGKEGAGEIVAENVKMPQIYQMHIASNISNRFANTTITSKVRNSAATAKEATFSVILPKEAFISGFIMEVEGVNYTAYVKEKEEAKRQYDQAVSSGLGAAHVAASARDSNKFTVSVNVEPETKAAFYLTYQELLKRKSGRYEHVINIHPGQPIKDLAVEVLISESRKITELRAPPLRSGNEIGNDDDELDPRADIETLSDFSALVKFSPNEERQKQLAHLMNTKEGDGLAAQFVVQYDVERDPTGGEVLIRDGYFVHFFAPKDLEPLPKHVVFVLDTSGSMYGSKIEQLKQAMIKILDQLHENDLLSLVEFNSGVKVCNLDSVQENEPHVQFPGGGYLQTVSNSLSDGKTPNAYPATSAYIAKAKASIRGFYPSGGTNILTALEVGLHTVELARQNKVDDVDRKPLIIFLTDGEPNVRDSSPDRITRKISEMNTGLKRTPIFSLSFGRGADKDFLQKLSLRNMGFSKHIYEASDAALQLEDFYNQISSPLLSDVTFKYDSSEFSRVTKTNFPIFYDGSEIVVAGFYRSETPLEPPAVESFCNSGPVTLKPVVRHSVTDIERLWAYLTIKQLLEQKDIADSNVEEIKKKALDLSLQYSLVTPLSSLVVVKPNATNAVDAEEADEKVNRGIYGVASPRVAYSSIPHHVSSGSGVVNYQYFARTGGPGGYYPRTHAISSSSFSSTNNLGAPGLAGPPSSGVALRTIGSPGPQGFGMMTHSLSTPSTPTLEDSIPWIKNILNVNGTISLPTGSYKLGQNDFVTANQVCNNTPLNGNGKCTLLKSCPGVHYLLTSVNVYEQHFCLLENEYAGVCCPQYMMQN